MSLQLIVIFALIVIFIVSFCGLLQKLRHGYEREIERNRSGTITVSEIYVTGPGYINRANSCVEDLESSGVYPSAIIGPPSYAEYQEPPPKYDDVIKKNPDLAAVHQTTIQIQDSTQVRSDRY